MSGHSSDTLSPRRRQDDRNRRDFGLRASVAVSMFGGSRTLADSFFVALARATTNSPEHVWETGQIDADLVYCYHVGILKKISCTRWSARARTLGRACCLLSNPAIKTGFPANIRLLIINT